MGTLNDNIAEYLSKTNGAATTYFVWGNIGGLYPSWAWGTLLCSNDNTANFIGIANSDKVAAFAHYENGAWEKVPVESLSNLTTTNKNSLVDAINEVNSNRFFATEQTISGIKVAKGSTVEKEFEFPVKTGYTRHYILSSIAGTGSNTAVINAHFSVVSVYAPMIDSEVSVKVMCIYTKD